VVDELDDPVFFLLLEDDFVADRAVEDTKVTV
jgi:hypothetical protein